MKIKYILYLFLGTTLLLSCERSNPKVIYVLPPPQSLETIRAEDDARRPPDKRLFGPIRWDDWPFIPVQKKSPENCSQKKSSSPMQKKKTNTWFATKQVPTTNKIEYSKDNTLIVTGAPVKHGNVSATSVISVVVIKR